MPFISVIVPIYNTAQYLDKCINSIIHSDLAEIEVLLIDDGSTDESGVIADKFAAADRRVRVVHKPNGGLFTSRNEGLRLAKGEYVAFVDSDDWITPDMLSSLYSKAKSSNADGCVCNYSRQFQNRLVEKYLDMKDEVIYINNIGLDSYIFK